MIGVGKTGSVIVKGVHRKTKKYVAIKIMKKANLLVREIDQLR